MSSHIFFSLYIYLQGMASPKTESVPLKHAHDGGYDSDNNTLRSRNDPPPEGTDEVEGRTLSINDSPPDGEDVVEGRNTLGDPPPEGTDEVEGRRTLSINDDETDSSSKSGAVNIFQSRSEITKGLYDVALLMANASQLRSAIDSTDNKYKMVLIGLLIASISLHMISAVLFYVLFIKEKQAKNKQQANESNSKLEPTVKQPSSKDRKQSAVCTKCFADITCCHCWRVYKTDIAATFCVIAVTVLNVFITAFGHNTKP
ncbi:uncharacterized protein LOC134715164 isoform X2 [Mytilus trossulus]|uniref:uncharacterized protein LOC134715164 isoform X2 n=1 Tax=Mytilus trossulus TaxID=6551 RepID=UPI0030040F00